MYSNLLNIMFMKIIKMFTPNYKASNHQTSLSFLKAFIFFSKSSPKVGGAAYMYLRVWALIHAFLQYLGPFSLTLM